ncbi:MAG: hypothetical protein LBK96_00470 [Prevotellaceae bacterium]|jgi:hypothetical protein|nr:hypothetical protein [Prevotellaceae bacterium]
MRLTEKEIEETANELAAAETFSFYGDADVEEKMWKNGFIAGVKFAQRRISVDEKLPEGSTSN